MHALIKSSAMKNRENILEFSGLALGEHKLEYKLNKTFFSSSEISDLEGIHSTVVDVILKKANHMMELNLSFSGNLDTVCDISNDPFTLEISNKFSLIVRFGEKYNDDNPEILILSHREYEINLNQLFFELIALSIPMQRIKPEYQIEEE